MTALSTFIRLYNISFVVFLIPSSSTIKNNDEVVSLSHIDVEPKTEITNKNKVVVNKHGLETETKKTVVDLGLQTADVSPKTVEAEKVDIKVETVLKDSKELIKPEKLVGMKEPDFWTTLHSIESKQGRLLYRPSNKNRNCKTTSSPCGHHQLSLNALKDISCSTKQCMDDCEDFEKSLAMSKQLLAINDKRLKKAGYKNLPEYQQYLVHQQGASGFKIILAASKGKKLLSKNLKKNMAGNSPYSYKKLRKFGSTLAAKKFLSHWEQIWQNEKILIINTNNPKKDFVEITKKEPKLDQPFFNKNELNLALNLKL